MDAIIKQFFDKKVGDFLKVDEGNLHVDAATGQFLLKKAAIVGHAFDSLHLPLTLTGGFIDELSIHLYLDVFNPGGNVSLQILIKNVCLVFGAHTTDWSYSHVKQCKSKLVDLVMKVLELKPQKKNKAAEDGSATGWLSHVQTRLKQDLMKKVAEMIEVNISNFHVRLEDSKTQAVPFACGFKLGYCAVFANEDSNSQRTTGTWRHTVENLADPLFSQTIVARRMSIYWDLDQAHRHFPSIPSGEEVFAHFKRLNLRETFSACVVEKLMELYPPSHPRRRYMEGPTFRERLDYHQYIVFPAGLNAHITASKNNEATKVQKAPLRDADVVVYSLDVAIDSEQLRSVNALLSYVKNFALKDTLMLSRPAIAIRDAKAGSSASRRSLVRAWWQHATKAVHIICKIPNRELCAEDLQHRAGLRERYIVAVNRAKDLAQGEAEAQSEDYTRAMDEVTEMQMMLKLKDILDWRMQARDRRAVDASPTSEVNTEIMEASPKERSTKERPRPQTLQVKVTFHGFQVFFLVAQDGFWYTKCKPGTLVDEERPEDLEPRSLSRKRMRTRQPVVSTSIKNITLQVIQKGHPGYRIAQWLEVSVGKLEVVNLNAGKQQPSRNIMSMQPIRKHKGLPMCFFLGLNTFQLLDNSFIIGDTPLSAVLEPWEGLLGHTKDQFSSATPVMLESLGFLKDQVHDMGRLMIFVFARIGQVTAIDWAPFRRRMIFFMKRGPNDMDLVTDLVRRPSQDALMKELLERLQRKVELAVGKSNMLGNFEVEMDGIQGRTVDHYNNRLVLCKQAQLSPLMLKVRRSGQPQAIEIQIYHLHTDALSAPSLSMIADGGVNLPWKTSMVLLPQDDFHCTAGSDKKMPRREASPRKVSENKRKGSTLRYRLGSSTSTGVMATSTPLEAAFFLKWCRNGRAKRRYVEFDDGLKAIVWKDHAAAKNAGVFPLSNIQDICVGIVTPVTRQAETPPVLCCRPKSGQRLDPNLLISIIAEDRTLDLQALSLQQHQRWADGLISRFRSHMENSTEVPGQVQYRPYPQRLRSDRCELRLTCERLHSMTSFSTTVQVMQGSVAGPKLCRSCGLPLSSSGCTHCGAPPEEAMIGAASQQRRIHGAGGCHS